VFFATGRDPEPAGSKHPQIVPYQAFATSDGSMNVAVGNDEIFRRMCAAIGRPELADDPRFETNPKRVDNREALEGILEERFAGGTTMEWVRRLLDHGVPAGPVYRISEIAGDPHVRARGNVLSFLHPRAGTIRQFGPPVRVKAGRVTHAVPPLLGQHTDDVLGSIGYSADRIDGLRRDGVI
jgi:formyl-CoA transferase/CoA:oxalate CoA-transferase